jgi:hypothetical protein
MPIVSAFGWSLGFASMSDTPSSGSATPQSSSADDFELRRLYRDGFVHLPGLIICFVATVLVTKVSSLLSPFSLYFSFSELVTTAGEGGYGLLPFFVKMFIPFGVGAIYFVAFKKRDATAAAAKDIGRKRLINLELTAATGAAFAALLLSWPAIMKWEFVVSETIFKYRVQFVAVYFLYFASFLIVAAAGVMAARLSWMQRASAQELRERLRPQYQFVLTVWAIVFALATGGFADWASKTIGPG